MRKLRSLIVDDDDDIRWILSLHLATGPVEVVGEAEDGLQAIELARELEPDIVLMDLLMPRMDGVEATTAIKKRHPETVVFGFTAIPEQGARLLRAGATAVFSKSSLDDLLLTLQRMFPY